MSETNQKFGIGKDGSMSLFEHLAELRIRLIRCFVVFIIFFAVSYAFRVEILDKFRAPVIEPLAKYRAQAQIIENEKRQDKIKLDLNYSCHCSESDITGDEERFELKCSCLKNSEDQITQENVSSSLVFLGMTELFFTQLKAAFFFGLFLAFPYLLIEIWGFVGPALYNTEKKVFWFFAVSSYVCFIGGSLFGYFVVFPFGFDFFLSLSQPGEIMPNLAIGEYFSFSLMLLFAFGIVFELPVVTLILARLGLINAKWMITNSKFALLIVFLLSAFLTPPDPFTMMLMAVPLCILYILSIVICFIGQKKKEKSNEESL